ncbi:tRNA(1)(Val) (adenine(37)-N(6))-methyltransferase TrmN, partial [Escherichia sp. HC-CC]
MSLLGYCSHPVLSPFFLQGFIFMSQSTSVLRRNGFTFKQFFVAHD